MSKPLKPRRGTTAQNNAEIGEPYEITYDIDKNTIVCRDGVTPGGFPLAREAEVGTIREDTIAAAQLAAGMSQGETGSLTLEGVAAEVGLKANASLDNLSSSGRSLAAGLGMPSRKGTTLTLGSSDARYTAPANGFFWVQKVATAANQKIALFNFSTGASTIVGTRSISAAAGNTLHVFVPAHKGDIVSCSYDAGGESVFRFTYAEGEEA